MSEPSAELLAEMQAERAEANRRRREKRLRDSGIPVRWLLGPEDIERDNGRRGAFDAAWAWSKGDEDAPLGVLLWGEHSRGKSRIAGMAATQRVYSGDRVTWLSVARHMRDLMMPFQSPEYVAACRALSPAREAALVLDDVDKITATDRAAQVLYVAVNDWLDADLPLLVTMNRHPDELAHRLGEDFGPAIASRLIEHCEVHEVRGRDRRLEPDG